jgi:molecular chaperone GrpE
MAEAKKKEDVAVEQAPKSETEAEAETEAPGLAEDGAEFLAEAELELVKAERDGLKDKWMRAMAEAENARKRGERDRREAEQYGGARLARDMLPIYDHLKRALEVAEEQKSGAEALIEGVELTLRELTNIFTKHGITMVAPKQGDRFDPALHQAMFEAPLPGTKAGEIIQVMTEGFLLHDRLLRPAQVGVSSSPAS